MSDIIPWSCLFVLSHFSQSDRRRAIWQDCGEGLVHREGRFRINPSSTRGCWLYARARSRSSWFESEFNWVAFGIHRENNDHKKKVKSRKKSSRRWSHYHGWSVFSKVGGKSFVFTFNRFTKREEWQNGMETQNTHFGAGTKSLLFSSSSSFFLFIS